jgi:uncharacterized membrane protein
MTLQLTSSIRWIPGIIHRARVGYSSVLNLGILTITLVGAWVLMPLVGIVGVGLACLGAQTPEAIASLPAFTHSRGLMIL